MKSEKKRDFRGFFIKWESGEAYAMVVFPLLLFVLVAVLFSICINSCATTATAAHQVDITTTKPLMLKTHQGILSVQALMFDTTDNMLCRCYTQREPDNVLFRSLMCSCILDPAR
jgi:hypothetical protein